MIRCLNLGSGPDAVPGWLNIDHCPWIRWQRLPLLGRWLVPAAGRFDAAVIWGDITRGLPYATGWFQAIYASHVLEHLPLEDARRALREIRRLLAPNGLFRGVMPDLALIVRHYVTALEGGDPAASTRLIGATGLGERTRPLGLDNRHRWLWDEAGWLWELREAGFHAPRRAVLGDASVAAQSTLWAAVELAHQWTGHLGFEARA